MLNTIIFFDNKGMFLYMKFVCLYYFLIKKKKIIKIISLKENESKYN